MYFVKALALIRPTVCALALVLSGCSGYQYVSSPRYVPLNEEKGELTANIYASGLQVGYAFSNNFSVFTTGYMRFPTIETANPLIGRDGQSHRSGDSREVNIGLSHFRKKDKFVYEVLIGGGFGNMTFANDHSGAKTREMDYRFNMQADRSNVFIQPNIGYNFFDDSRKFRLAVALFAKVNRVYYYNIETEIYATKNPGVMPDFDAGIEYFGSRTEANLLFIEPGVQVKGGWKKVRGQAQISPVINASGHALHYQWASISVGVSLSLDLLKRE